MLRSFHLQLLATVLVKSKGNGNTTVKGYSYISEVNKNYPKKQHLKCMGNKPQIIHFDRREGIQEAKQSDGNKN